MLDTLLITADLFLTGFTVGTTVWFFFIQSPMLFNLMGREKFVPIMMQMTRLWVQTMFLSTSALLVVSFVLKQNFRESLQFYFVLAGWVAILINRYVVVPKALKAGASSHQERKGDSSKDVKSFVVEGGSKTETKTLHQTVVVFVLVMAAALVAHLIDMAAQ
jgi:hypothetical protein